MRIEPAALWSGIKHSTTDPLPNVKVNKDNGNSEHIVEKNDFWGKGKNKSILGEEGLHIDLKFKTGGIR